CETGALWASRTRAAMLPEHRAIFTPLPSHRNSSESNFSFGLIKNRQLNHAHGGHERKQSRIQPENTKNSAENGSGAIPGSENSYPFDSITRPDTRNAFPHQP
ncbi:MAG: hypothetical protein ABIR56_05770, partial [Polaromonas sp.]